MNIARVFFAIASTALLCGASKPKVETSILLAKPIKIVKFLGYKEMENPDLPEDIPNLPGDGLFIVKMKTISVSEGNFSKRTFNAYIEAPTGKHIFITNEWAIIVNRVDGEEETIVGVPVQKSFCSSPEGFAKIVTNPSYLYSLTNADGFTLSVRCYDIH